MLAFSGCQRESVQSYQIPKEDYSVRPMAAAKPGMEQSHAPAGDALPHVHWELPKGWEEKASEGMSAGRFRIPGEGGKFAEVSIVPMPAAARVPNLLEQTVEMWKEKLELGESTNEVKASQVEIAGSQGKLYDLVSDKLKARLTAAILDRDGTYWFIRMSGEESVVTAQQDAFRGFLKSLSFHEETPAATAAGPGVESKWKAPEGWTAVAPGQMVLAAYTVNGKANVSVSSLGGSAGGLLPNVNRWRGQIGLGPVTEAEIPNLTKQVTLSNGTKATAVDLKSETKTLFALIVPRAGETWFYKIIGDAATVAAEKEKLAEFAVIAK